MTWGPERTSDMRQSMSGSAKLLIKSQPDGTADLVLKDYKLITAMAFGDDEEDEPVPMEPLPLVVAGMREDGTLEVGNTTQETLLLKRFFPLPPRPLAVGDSVDIPLQMPFNAMESPLTVKGRAGVTLTEYVTIEDHTCARLDTEIDISQLDVPADMKGEYRCSLKGTSVFYFDIEERRLAAGEVAFVVHMETDTPEPTVQSPVDAPPQQPERTRISATSDNFITVTAAECR